MRPVVTVSEWGRLELPAELQTARTRHRILRHASTPRGTALALRGRHIYAQGLAGVMDAGPIRVEILPKVYVDSDADEDARTLLGLFSLALFSSPSAVVPAATGSRGGSMLEPLLAHFGRLLERTIRAEGVPRRYEASREVSAVVRGRIDTSRIARTGPTRGHEIPIVHYPLQGSNRLTRVLAAVAGELGRRSSIARTRSAFSRCLDLLALDQPISLHAGLFHGLELSRLESHWSPFVSIGRLLAVQKSPDATRFGEESPFGLMLPLERLFESALLRALKVASAGTPLVVRGGPPGHRFLRAEAGGRELLSVRPDIFFTDASGKALAVGDAKWKRLIAARPGLALSPGDAYQMSAYERRFAVSAGYLFYPSPEPLATTWRASSWRFVGAGSGSLSLVEVDTARILHATRATRHTATDDLRKLLEKIEVDARAGAPTIPV